MLGGFTISRIEWICNAFGVLAITVTLALAFIFQIVFHELPCPLCLLQRIGFFGVAFGFLLNLRFGLRPSHYAIVLLSALYIGFTSLRQIALHVFPGTGAYGDPVFGLHLYTWSFIISMVILVVTSVLLGIDQQYEKSIFIRRRYGNLTNILFGALVILLGLNIFSTTMECGISACPENPTHYLY